MAKEETSKSKVETETGTRNWDDPVEQE